MIPAGGLSPDHSRWIHPRYPFFLPVRVLSRVFRGKFIAGLKRAFRQGKLGFPGSLKLLAAEKAFMRFCDRCFARTGWSTPSRHSEDLNMCSITWHATPIASPSPTTGIVNIADGKVTFRWKDYAHRNKKRKMTVTAEEFLRRFLLHTLPRGFVRIRFFGFLANRRRGALLPLCRQLLEAHSAAYLQPRTASAPTSHVRLAVSALWGRNGSDREAYRPTDPLEIGWRESFADTS